MLQILLFIIALPIILELLYVVGALLFATVMWASEKAAKNDTKS